MISINLDTNVLMAQRNMNIASNYVNEALQRLTTGFRINSPADDPAGYYLASNLNTELRAFIQKIKFSGRSGNDQCRPRPDCLAPTPSDRRA